MASKIGYCNRYITGLIAGNDSEKKYYDYRDECETKVFEIYTLLAILAIVIIGGVKKITGERVNSDIF